MTGTIELSDQDVQDLVRALESSVDICRGWQGLSAQQQREMNGTIDRLQSLKERLLKEVNVNEF